jgi:hypothetical protein
MNTIKITFLIIIFSATVSFTQTVNPDKPLKGTWNFKMKKVWEVENAGDNIIAKVQTMRVAPDGRVYVVDQKNRLIYIYSKDGKYITAFGRSGEGPGEIMGYGRGDQLFVTGSTLIFSEWGRLSYFALDGTFKKIVRLPDHITPRTFISEGEFISAPAAALDESIKKEKIILYKVKDKSEKTILEYSPFDKASSTVRSNGAVVTVRMIIEDITPMMFIKFWNGKIYYGMSDHYKINISNLSGKNVKSFSIPQRKPKAVTKEYKQNKGKGRSQEMVQKIIDSLPDQASFFSNLEIDRNGYIYVFVSNPVNEVSQAIDIFSREGKFLYTSLITAEKEHTIESIYLKDDVLLLATEDEEGTQKIAKYAITIPQ